MLDHRRRLGVGAARESAPQKYRQTPMHLSALKFGISPPIFLWSTAAAAQSRGWLILSLFCSKACLSCQAKFNIYHKRTRRRSLNCVLIAGFTLTRHVAEKQYHFRLQGAYHMAVRCIANVVYWFSCSESNSNWLLYWRETPMRILHFYCAYLHTSTLLRIADILGRGRSPWLPHGPHPKPTPMVEHHLVGQSSLGWWLAKKWCTCPVVSYAPVN